MLLANMIYIVEERFVPTTNKLNVAGIAQFPKAPDDVDGVRSVERDIKKYKRWILPRDLFKRRARSGKAFGYESKVTKRHLHEMANARLVIDDEAKAR
jgi:hypothetical protein